MEKKEILYYIILPAAAAAAVVIAVAAALMLRVRAESYRSIRVVELKGDVSIDREGVGNLQASANMNLISGDRISTSEDAYAVLRLDEDKYVMLGEEGAIQVLASGNASDGRTEIHLETGSIVNNIQKPLSQDSTYEIVTPSATMSVRGTVFEVRWYPDGEVGEVLTYEGSVAVTLESREPMLYNHGEYTQFQGGDTPQFLVERETITNERIDLRMISFLYQIDENERELDFGEGNFEELVEQAREEGFLTVEEDQVRATQEPAATPVPTVTPTPTPKPTITPTSSPRPTVTPTATPKPTVAPTATPKPTVTPTPSPATTETPAKSPESAPDKMQPNTPADSGNEQDEGQGGNDDDDQGGSNDNEQNGSQDNEQSGDQDDDQSGSQDNEQSGSQDDDQSGDQNNDQSSSQGNEQDSSQEDEQDSSQDDGTNNDEDDEDDETDESGSVKIVEVIVNAGGSAIIYRGESSEIEHLTASSENVYLGEGDQIWLSTSYLKLEVDGNKDVILGETVTFIVQSLNNEIGQTEVTMLGDSMLTNIKESSKQRSYVVYHNTRPTVSAKNAAIFEILFDSSNGDYYVFVYEGSVTVDGEKIQAGEYVMGNESSFNSVNFAKISDDMSIMEKSKMIWYLVENWGSGLCFDENQWNQLRTMAEQN